MTTADPLAAASIKRGRSRVQGIDHHIAARVRERRTMLGLTQQQLAGLVGVSWQQLHKYEKGSDRISAGRLPALARSFAVLPRRQQEAICELARAFAGAGEGGKPVA